MYSGISRPYSVVSYHSIVVPIVEAMTARTSWRLVRSRAWSARE
jgi:hypothetical protein